MDDLATAGRRLSGREISEAVGDLGWRYVLGTIRSSVRVGSLAQAVEAVEAAVAAGDGDRHLSMEVRHDQLILTLHSLDPATATQRDIELARAISAALLARGLRTDAGAEGGDAGSVQLIEVAIDALDPASVRPFWKAVTGYEDEAGRSGPEDPLVDTVRHGPAIWFQRMDVPRPQRNRVHLDISVPHDEADRRIQAALAAGGVLVSEARAPAFWVLADAEGNEACITTWQGRDDQPPTPAEAAGASA